MENPTFDREVVVLLAEEDPVVRGMLERLLKQGGYDLIIAEDGQDAFQKHTDHKGRIDLLVCTVQMPGLTGSDLARQMRLTRPELRVMLTSSLSAGFVDSGYGMAIHTKTVRTQSAGGKNRGAYQESAIAARGS